MTTLAPSIVTFRNRVIALEEACIAGSKAYAGVTLAAFVTPYWINQVLPVTPVRIDSLSIRYAWSIRMGLVRKPITSGVDLELEAACLADVEAVLTYFTLRPLLEDANFANPLAGIEPNSVAITANGLRTYPVDSVTHLGTDYTLTFNLLHIVNR